MHDAPCYVGRSGSQDMPNYESKVLLLGFWGEQKSIEMCADQKYSLNLILYYYLNYLNK